MSTFVGRGADLDKTVELLAGARLVTVSGWPGVGKTRLAMEVAARVTARFPDGAWLVQLAPVSEPDLVVAAVASAVRARERPGSGIGDSLAAELAGRRLLLVLDSCEHVIGAAARLATTLLESCPDLTILATSQEALGVPGEHLWLIRGLSGDDGDQAVELFRQRAAAVSPEFDVDDRNRDAVVEVCQRLDGIPLAIELAAARAAMFSPAEIALRLDDRFGFLTAGNRAALPRHQTLKAAVDWSYDLLSPAEQVLLRRLAVFAGGFAIDAVAEVCAGGEVDGAECADLVARLVSKSLVSAEPVAGGTRYRLPETIRDYGRDRQIGAGDSAATATRHLAWCLGLAERAEAELTGPGQHAWLGTLHGEHDNLRAALRWGLSEGRTEDVLRLAGALTLFWRMRGHFRAGLEWLDLALAASEEAAGDGAPSHLRAKALWGRGLLTAMLGDYSGAGRAGQESLELWRELGDRRGGARSLLLLGSCALVADGPEASMPMLRQSVALAGEVGDSWCRAHALALCGWSLNQQGDMAAARPMLEECIREARRSHDDQCLAFGLNGLGYVAMGEARYLEAARCLEEALGVARATGGTYEAASSLSDLGYLAILEGDYDRARSLLDEAIEIARRSSSTDAIVYATDVLGRLAQAEGDNASAAQHFSRSLELARVSHGTSAVALQGLGETKIADGDLRRAAPLLKEALELARRTGHKGRTAAALSALGDVARAQREHSHAAALHHQALAIRAEIGDRLGIVESLESLAGLAARSGRCDQAARVFAAAEASRRTNGLVRPASRTEQHQADFDVCRNGLPDAEFERLLAEGRELSDEQAVSYLSKGRGARLERPASGWDALTVAEKEVATLAAYGLTNAEIGEKLFVSGNTVKSHLARIFAKLKVSSRRDLTKRLVAGPGSDPVK